MKFICVLGVILLFSLSLALAQEQPRSQDDQPHIVPKKLPQPEEQPTPGPPGESSSKDSGINLEDPGRDPAGRGSDSVTEMHPFDPHKAAKDVEVGEYYLKRKNYRAALDRFNEALLYKPNDAEATIRLAQTQEKLELYDLAYHNYQKYLNTISDGPFAKDAQEGMKRIEPRLPKAMPPGQSSEAAQMVQEGEAFLAKNDFESAHSSFVRALQAAPDDPVANFRLAQSLKGLQRLDEARIFYRKYLSLHPSGSMANDAKREIAQIDFVLGKPRE